MTCAPGRTGCRDFGTHCARGSTRRVLLLTAGRYWNGCVPPYPHDPRQTRREAMTHVEIVGTLPSPPPITGFSPALSADIRPLTDATLGHHGEQLSVPTYDRSALTPAVVHFSVGGFHRAHQLLYFDEIAERRISDGWGVVGVGLHSRHMKDALAPQDHLYTVVERSPDGERARVVGVMVDYHFAPDDPATVLDLLTDERTRMVSLTITGNGYRLCPQSGEFDADDEDVA